MSFLAGKSNLLRIEEKAERGSSWILLLPALQEDQRHLFFEGRLDAIASGGDTLPPETEQSIAELQTQRRQALEDQIQKVKTALGDSRFAKLDATLRAAWPKPSAAE